MKYLKLYESFLTVEEKMSHLRRVAKRIVQNLPNIPKKQGAEFILDEKLSIVVKRLSTSKNLITFTEMEVYHDDNHIGNISLDFISEEPHILVVYDLNTKMN
jgi:hypothetical protein